MRYARIFFRYVLPRLFSLLLYPHALLQQIVESLSEADPKLLAAHVAVLAQLATRVPAAFEQRSDIITKHLLKYVLMESAAPEEVS
jgi:hypothetical protein